MTRRLSRVAKTVQSMSGLSRAVNVRASMSLNRAVTQALRSLLMLGRRTLLVRIGC